MARRKSSRRSSKRKAKPAPKQESDGFDTLSAGDAGGGVYGF